MKLEFDDALEKVGGFGFIQFIHFFLIFLLQIFQSPFIVLLAFIGKEPSITCKGRPGADPCHLEPPCKEFVYDQDYTSIVSEWNLVCDRKRQASYSQSLLMFGFLIGVVALGWTSDKFGRLKTYVWGMILLVAVQLASGLSQNIYQFGVSRFLVGFLSGGGGLAGLVLMLEFLVPRRRALINNIYHSGFAVGLVMTAVMAYYVRDWRHLTYVSCVPMVILILVPLVIPESARWLASHGHIEEAEDQLMYFAKKNGVRVSRAEISLANKTDDAKGKNSTGALDLFRTPILRRRMVILMFTWCTCCMAYYGLTFGASNLGGNMYVNFALSGFVEVPANLLSIYALNCVGRRLTVAGSLFVAALSCLGVMVLQKSDGGDMSATQTSLALIGKMGISVAFNSVYLFSSELLPTVLRNTAMGVCSMSARVGGIIAPMLPPFGARFAYLLFGLTALVSAFMVLMLPESLNKQLPETVMDVENGPSVPVSRKEKHQDIVS